jgi:hypothetical protein
MFKRHTRFGVLILTLAIVPSAMADGWTIDWHTVDGGGAMFSTSATFSLGGTIGQPDAGSMTGGSFEITGGFWAGAGILLLLGDCDGDGDIDLDDYVGFSDCQFGPGAETDVGCDCFDTDGDGDVDLLDFRVFQFNFMEG